MTSTRQMPRSPGGRARVLLVLAVLGGLVVMHGLGPAGATVPERSVPTAVTSIAVTSVAADPHRQRVEGDRRTAGGDHSGHVEHADDTCAARGAGTAPALPALTAAGFAVSAAGAPSGWAGSVTATGRAPPSLSELQILRM